MWSCGNIFLPYETNPVGEEAELKVYDNGMQRLQTEVQSTATVFNYLVHRTVSNLKQGQTGAPYWTI